MSSSTISPDGRYLFFVRIEGGLGVSYWVSTTVVERLRPDDGAGQGTEDAGVGIAVDV